MPKPEMAADTLDSEPCAETQGSATFLPARCQPVHPASEPPRNHSVCHGQRDFPLLEELNDFLPAARWRQEFSCACARAATTKHMIEALGVPHTEVELVLVNGVSVGFERVRAEPLRELRFVADVHLGGLAHLLCMAGFDTLYDPHFAAARIAELAASEGRIVLTRDRELLKRRSVSHGCYVYALKPALQLRELFERLDLASSARPFSLCLHCNLPLREADRDALLDRLPPRGRELYRRFLTCDHCQRVFWEGSHWRSMRAVLAPLLGGDEPRA